MYAVITATGPDASSFLQAQLSQDLAAVRADSAPLAAWLSPKGRVLAVLRLFVVPDGIGMLLPAEMVEDTIAGLLRYRLRAKVDLQRDANWHAFAVAADPDLGLLEARGLLPAKQRDAAACRDGIVCISPNGTRDHIEIIATPAALESAELNFSGAMAEHTWQRARLASGIPDIMATTRERYTAHMLNLDRIGAVSFDKGCYPGQEIVARTQHLGRARRRLAAFRCSAPLAIGTPVELDGTSVGEVIGAAEDFAAAVLPEDLHGKRLQAAGAKLQPAEFVD